MAKTSINYYSESLNRNAEVNILLPEQYGFGSRQKGHPIEKDFPVLYLLHGYNSDKDTWSYLSQLPFFARELPLCIVMPSAYNSWYGPGVLTDMNYTNFLSNELPKVMKSLFNISNKREDTFIGGLSMGGFGSILMSLKYPEKYSYCFSFSGVLDMDLFYEDNNFKKGININRDIFLGDRDDLIKNDIDIDVLLERNIKENKELPKYYIACGDDDPVLEYNRSFKNKLENNNIDFKYKEAPGGHDWNFWNKEIQEVLKELKLERY